MDFFKFSEFMDFMDFMEFMISLISINIVSPETCTIVLKIGFSYFVIIALCNLAKYLVDTY